MNQEAEPKTKAKPFVKWAGGKTQLLDELVARVPKKFGRYHEPFAGGAALFWRLGPERATLSDACAELVATYQIVRDDVDELLHGLRWLAKRHTRDRYYAVRKAKYEGRVTAAARFIYLNRTCFNGIYRVSVQGVFNTPYGGEKTYASIVQEKTLRACSAALQGVDIYERDFRVALADVQPGDLVYCDPPYAPTNQKATFTLFTAERFGPRDQVDLAERLRSLKAAGAHVLASNSGGSEVHWLYAGFRREPVAARRNINSDGAGRGKVIEYIIR